MWLINIPIQTIHKVLVEYMMADESIQDFKLYNPITKQKFHTSFSIA